MMTFHLLSHLFQRKLAWLIGPVTLICMATVGSLQAQTPEIIDRKAIHVASPHGQDTIDFLIGDTSLADRKPVLLFCQGSLPIPLFALLDGYGLYLIGGGLSNLDLDTVGQVYHPVVISMPYTPLVADQSHLNGSFCYVPDLAAPRQFDPRYLNSDTLDTYVDRALAVLDWLREQPWVDPEGWVVAGHSQGAKVATKVARSTPWITRLGLFSPNPYGRVDQFIREARLDAQLGRQSWETVDTLITEYVQLSRLSSDPAVRASDPGLKTLWSFSEPMIDDWLDLEIPIYIAYGTEDRSADLCDLVPLFFIREGKENLTLKRYIHREHNFFPVGPDGRPDQERPGWPEVMNAFVRWSRGN